MELYTEAVTIVDEHGKHVSLSDLKMYTTDEIYNMIVKGVIERKVAKVPNPDIASVVTHFYNVALRCSRMRNFSCAEVSFIRSEARFEAIKAVMGITKCNYDEASNFVDEIHNWE